MKKIFVTINFCLFFLCGVFVCIPISQIMALDMVDINTATLQQLDQITGVGPATAQKIVDARPFSSVDDLLRVKGIGPATLQKIKDQGLACVNCTTTITASQQPTPIIIPTPVQSPVPVPAPITVSAPTPTTTPEPVVYLSGIVFNELLPSPQGADEEGEYFEIFNSNNFDVDLSGWQVKDVAGATTTYTIPKGTKILANGYLVFKRPDTKIMLNNGEDGLTLLTPDGKTEDSVSYTTKAPLGQSYNKISSGWAWSTTLTPGLKNIITTLSKPTAATKPKKANTTSGSASDKPLLSADTSLEDLLSENGAASVSGSNSSPWLLFFVTIFAIIAGAGILFLKKVLDKRKQIDID